MVEFTFLKELMLIKQLNQKSATFTLLVFFKLQFLFQPNVCNRCHYLFIMYSDIAILNIKGSDYRCIISLISKNETINLMENADLTEKSGTF